MVTKPYPHSDQNSYQTSKINRLSRLPRQSRRKRPTVIPVDLFDLKLLTLLIAGSMTTMAGGVIAPVVPEMVGQLHLNPVLAANLVSLHCLTIAVFSLPLGMVADRKGRLQVLVLSLALYGVFGTAGAFVHDITFLLITRGLLGIASGGIAAASLGLLTSLYEGEARTQALAYATTTLTLTGIVYPVLGGWVGATQWQNAFFLYAVSFPLALLAAIVLQQPAQTAVTGSTQTSHGKLGQVLGHVQVLWLLLLLGLASVVMYAVVIYAPLYLKITIGAGAALNGIILAARAIGAAMVSAFGTRWLVRRLGRERTIAFGFTLMAITLAMIPMLTQLSWILLTAILFGVGFGVVLPQLYSRLADFTPANLRSSILAVGTGAGFLGQFLSPILLAPVLSHSGLPSVFYAAASVALVSGSLLLYVRGKQQTSLPPKHSSL